MKREYPITQNSTDQTVARLGSACTTRSREPNTVHEGETSPPLCRHHSMCESVLSTAIAQHMNEHQPARRESFRQRNVWQNNGAQEETSTARTVAFIKHDTLPCSGNEKTHRFQELHRRGEKQLLQHEFQDLKTDLCISRKPRSTFTRPVFLNLCETTAR